MRLWTPHLAVRRTWTVELRPQPRGPQLSCPQCGPAAVRVCGATARSAALTHLAGHARLDALPRHLRTCQCHERGCRWHPRHRGCGGPVVLVLARELGGRLWRLADVCTNCAAATHDAAVVPETPAGTPPVRSRRRRSPAPPGLGPHERIRDMLSYLAAALPPAIGPQARLLALQCALRADRHGHVRMPGGLLRGMLLAGQATGAWQELVEARWLHHTRGPSGGHQAQLLDATVLTQAPGRALRAQAAGLALRTAHSPATRTQSAAVRLTAVALNAFLPPGAVCGSVGVADFARICALPEDRLRETVEVLRATGPLSRWSLYFSAAELHWRPAQAPPGFRPGGMVQP
ncbi:hypothetical protein [Streptomyces sp. NPDC087297]|uniref:hypothetical protein n=1 Tax=Streptomyces sp. NPDC087297 TaxID=3365778 RepID=UPI00382447A1